VGRNCILRQARGTHNGAILALVPGQEVNAVLFRLVRGCAITGRVIDEAGEPMVSVTVSVLPPPLHQPESSVP